MIMRAITIAGPHYSRRGDRGKWYLTVVGRAQERTPSVRSRGPFLDLPPSAEGIPELSQGLALLVERDVGVDRHRDFDVGVADDVADYVRRDAKIK
jgi:hypothetical protein